MKTSIVDLHQLFYIPAIQKLALNLIQVHIIRTHQCGNLYLEVFKYCADFHNVLCNKDYPERVAASFGHQIKSEYYGGNISVSIEGIEL